MAKSVSKTLSSLPKRAAYSASDKKVIDDTLEWMYGHKKIAAPVPKWSDVARALRDDHGVVISANYLAKLYERSFN